jgi:hypothetical protein
VNLSREVIKNVTAYAEFWADYNNDPVIKATQLSFDTALAWTVFPNVQLDVGANFGLNAVTPAIQVYAGASCHQAAPDGATQCDFSQLIPAAGVPSANIATAFAGCSQSLGAAFYR